MKPTASQLRAKLSEALVSLSSSNKLDEKLEHRYLTRVAMAILNEDTSLKEVAIKLRKSHVTKLKKYLGNDVKMAIRFVILKHNDNDYRIFRKIKTINNGASISTMESLKISMTLYLDFIETIKFNIRETFESLCDQLIENDYTNYEKDCDILTELLTKSQFVAEALKSNLVQEQELLDIINHRQELKNLILTQTKLAA